MRLSIKRIRKFVKQTLFFCLIFTMQHIHTLVSCSFIYIYIYIYIHIYVCLYIYVYVYIYIYAFMSPQPAGRHKAIVVMRRMMHWIVFMTSLYIYIYICIYITYILYILHIFITYIMYVYAKTSKTCLKCVVIQKTISFGQIFCYLTKSSVEDFRNIYLSIYLYKCLIEKRVEIFGTF